MAKRLSQRDALILKAERALQESKQLDFKGQFEDTNECWCAPTKDIVAMANSGGGILVLGLNSNGTPSGNDCNALLNCDLAVISSKVFKWTGYEFAELETLTVTRSDGNYPALIVGEADVPIPFSKPGEWEKPDGKKKTEFAEGTVYFRHGAKSAPGTRADFSKWIERYASAERQRLMQGVKKIVAAPPGHVVAAVTTSNPITDSGSGGLVAQLSNDPKAIKIMPRRAGDFYPHRGVELRERVNGVLEGTKINSHDIVSVNNAYRVFTDHPEFATKPHEKTGPLYSDQYVEWLVQHIRSNPNFLSDARNTYAAAQREKGVTYTRKKNRK
jgi:hypothetical protein